jgi:hypothetical protein
MKTKYYTFIFFASILAPFLVSCVVVFSNSVFMGWTQPAFDPTIHRSFYFPSFAYLFGFGALGSCAVMVFNLALFGDKVWIAESERE